jgi:hypothetical protein
LFVPAPRAHREVNLEIFLLKFHVEGCGHIVFQREFANHASDRLRLDFGFPPAPRARIARSHSRSRPGPPVNTAHHDWLGKVQPDQNMERFLALADAPGPRRSSAREKERGAIGHETRPQKCSGKLALIVKVIFTIDIRARCP